MQRLYYAPLLLMLRGMCHSPPQRPPPKLPVVEAYGVPPSAEGEQEPRKKIKDICIVVDASSSMTKALEACKRAVRDFLPLALDQGIKVAICGFSDHCDDHPFTGGDFTGDQRVLTLQVDGLKIQNGGDIPEAVMYALARITPGVAGAPAWSGGRGLVIVITDAPPHLPEINTPSFSGNVEAERRKIKDLGLDPDAVSLLRGLKRCDIQVATVMIGMLNNIYPAMAEITGGPGAFKAPARDSETIYRQLKMIIELVNDTVTEDCLPEKSSLYKVSALDAELLAGEPRMSRVAAGIMQKSPESVSGEELIQAVQVSFGGKLRRDGVVDRVRGGRSLGEAGKDMLESLGRIIRGVERILEDHSGREDMKEIHDVITRMTLRDTLEEFLRRANEASSLASLEAAIDAVSSIVFVKCFASQIPTGDAKYNYNCMWDFVISEVVEGVSISAESLQMSREILRGPRAAGAMPGRGDLVRIQSLLTRERDVVAGGVPCTDGSDTLAMIYSLLGPDWMNAITMFAVSEHACPTPNAFPASAATALFAATKTGAAHSARKLAHTIGAPCMTIEAVPALCRAFGACLEASGGEATAAAVDGAIREMSVSNNGGPVKSFYALARALSRHRPRGDGAPPPGLGLLLSLTAGDAYSHRIARCLDEDHRGAIAASRFAEGISVPPVLRRVFVTDRLHPLETGHAPPCAGVHLRGPAKLHADVVKKSFRELLAALRGAGVSSVSSLDVESAMRAPTVDLRFLESIVFRDARARTDFLTLAPRVSLAADARSLERDVSALILAKTHRDDLSELKKMRRDHVVETVIVPKAVEAILSGGATSEDLVAALNKDYEHPVLGAAGALVAPSADIVRLVLDEIAKIHKSQPEIQAMDGRTRRCYEKKIFTLVSGKKAEGLTDTVWSRNSTFDKRLASHDAVPKSIAQKIIESFPADHVTVPGSNNWHRAWNNYGLLMGRRLVFGDDNLATVTVEDARVGASEHHSRTKPVTNFILANGAVVIKRVPNPDRVRKLNPREYYYRVVSITGESYTGRRA